LKIGPQASIPSDPPHRAHNTTTMQYKTKTHKINLRTVKWAQCDKTQSREL